MAVYDRWHRDPREGDSPCSCGKGRNRLYPSADHLQGRRWQVRWRDPGTGKQKTRAFALRDGANPNVHAAAFDREVQGSIVRNDYQDPDAGNVTLRAYAEQYRRTRVHGESAAAGLESRLRNHVYPDGDSDRTPAGGVAIGHHTVAYLARRPSLVAAWLAALPLADSSRALVLGDVSAVFRAALEDGAVRSNPCEASTVDRPARGRSKAQPYAPAEVAALAAAMPGRFALVPYLGALTGMREMEMCGLGADDITRGRAPRVRVTRQLKVIGGELRWGPVKNRKPHGVPVPAELLELLDAHMERFPPVAVTLPWHEPGSKLHGQAVTVRLILSRDGKAPASRNVTDAAWRTGAGRALAAHGIGRSRKRSAARGHGIHRLRHTFASTQLRAGVDPVRVAAWMGDTPEMVMKTYAHLMPGDHDGEAAGRAALAAFLGSCEARVQPEEPSSASGQLRAV